MVMLDLKALTAPLGVVRILAVVLTCLSFSLVASVGHTTHSFWVWCMFSWCACFCVTLLVLVVELACLKEKLLISWDDFTAAFAMLATLMVLTTSIIYPIYFLCSMCGRQIAATVTSILTFLLYATEVWMIRARPDTSGFLATVPGLLKILQAFVACIIFICLDYSLYYLHVGLQWCVAVYSMCFIFTALVIVLTICRVGSVFPVHADKVLLGCNILAVLLYATAVVVWPLYSLRNNPRPVICSGSLFCAGWDNLVVISCMTCLNLVAYIVDTVYSFKLFLL